MDELNEYKCCMRCHLCMVGKAGKGSNVQVCKFEYNQRFFFLSSDGLL